MVVFAIMSLVWGGFTFIGRADLRIVEQSDGQQQETLYICSRINPTQLGLYRIVNRPTGVLRLACLLSPSSGV